MEYQRSVFPNEQASGDMDGNLMMRYAATVTADHAEVIGTVQEGEVYAYVSSSGGRERRVVAGVGLSCWGTD